MIRILKVILEGIFWATVGIVLLWLTLPSDFLDHVPPAQGGLFDNAFARRWDGSCTGWTQSLATFHVIGDLLLWNAYVVISLVMWRLHPIIKRVPTARITVPLICSVFLTCGAVHLFSAYAVFNPIYVFDGVFKTFAGVIGLCAAVYIAHDLVTVFDVIEKEHYRLKILEAKLAGRSNLIDSYTHQPLASPVSPNPRLRIIRAITIGLAWSLVALLLLVPKIEPVESGFFRNDFASMWSGGCSGWTKPLAMLHIVGSSITWSAYVVIGMVVYRLHPISKRVRLAKIMVPVVGLVLVTCGAVHLLNAYGIFNPIFVAIGSYKIFVAVVSLTGAVLVSHTLVMVFDVAVKERRRLMELEAQVTGGR